MKYAVLLWLFCLLTACTSGSKGTMGGDRQEQQDLSQTMSYSAFLANVKKGRRALHKPEAAADLLFISINDGIAHYWSGTAWDFNGVTRKPREGAIACGYFITNMLTDLGFRIQRVRLAQQASSEMIKTLTKDIARVGSIKDLNAYLDKQKVHSVFIVGLDFHTGFILKTNDGCYFFTCQLYRPQRRYDGKGRRVGGPQQQQVLHDRQP